MCSRAGLLVNFFSFVIFTSQQVQAIALAGQLPAVLAYRHPVHDTPIAASVFSSLVGCTVTVSFAAVFDISYAQDILVTACLMPAALGGWVGGGMLCLSSA